MPKPSDFFECQQCGECCKGYGGAFVNDREIGRISQYLDIDQERFLCDYCDWSGGRPLIKTAESGHCIFWDKLCTIHEVKPRMCKIWPFIESILVDPSNWAIIKSMCPGVRDNGDLDGLAECVRIVLAEYDRRIPRSLPTRDLPDYSSNDGRLLNIPATSLTVSDVISRSEATRNLILKRIVKDFSLRSK